MVVRKRPIYKKHQLQTGRYKAKEGVIRLPRDCYWMVLRHSGGGEFTNELDADGAIALILSDDSGRGRSGSWPVISFLSNDEARHLARRLEEFAGPGPEPEPPTGSYDPKKRTGQLL
jgi:hypothetical protein